MLTTSNFDGCTYIVLLLLELKLYLINTLIIYYDMKI